MRYSAVPDHCKSFKSRLINHILSYTLIACSILVATAVFASAGMNMLVFITAAVLSLPKQFVNVYIGSVLAEAANGDESTHFLSQFSNLID